MSDNIKLIIEIPKDYYEIIKRDVECHLTDYRPFLIIGNGAPLDTVKAEIEKKCDRINSIASVLRYPQHREIQELLCEILTSIDNAESEANPNETIS